MDPVAISELKELGLPEAQLEAVIRATGPERQAVRVAATEMAALRAAALIIAQRSLTGDLEPGYLDALASLILEADRCGTGGLRGLGHNPADQQPGSGATVRPLTAILPDEKIDLGTGRWQARDGLAWWRASKAAEGSLVLTVPPEALKWAREVLTATTLFPAWRARQAVLAAYLAAPEGSSLRTRLGDLRTEVSLW